LSVRKTEHRDFALEPPSMFPIDTPDMDVKTGEYRDSFLA
jgi:hypothetical protein